MSMTSWALLAERQASSSVKAPARRDYCPITRIMCAPTFTGLVCMVQLYLAQRIRPRTNHMVASNTSDSPCTCQNLMSHSPILSAGHACPNHVQHGQSL